MGLLNDHILTAGMIFRDIRWLSSRRQQFIALSTEQIAFYEDIGEVRPKLLGCLPFNRTNELVMSFVRSHTKM